MYVTSSGFSRVNSGVVVLHIVAVVITAPKLAKRCCRKGPRSAACGTLNHNLAFLDHKRMPSFEAAKPSFYGTEGDSPSPTSLKSVSPWERQLLDAAKLQDFLGEIHDKVYTNNMVIIFGYDNYYPFFGYDY